MPDKQKIINVLNNCNISISTTRRGGSGLRNAEEIAEKIIKALEENKLHNNEIALAL